MSRYIDEDDVLRRVKPYDSYDERWAVTGGTAIRLIHNAVANAPTADVAPVVHGHWEKPHWQNSDYCCNCSVCKNEAMHKEFQWHKNGIYPYCPNCGAKLDEVTE